MEHFAWPAVVLVLGLFGLFMFKRHVGGLIERIRKIDKTGITTGNVPDQGQALVESKPKAFEALMDAANSPVLLAREARIREQLDAKGINNEQERIRVLTRALAESQIIMWSQQIDAVIYGSQLNLLVTLNSRPAGMTVAEMKPFYDAAASQHPNLYANDSFERYLNFLVVSGLIRANTSGFEITLEAKEFLQWLVRSGRTHPRAF